ncbi:glycine--tRNA ligase subunit beta [Parasphingorhabdus sp. JC815]|uniref:glycine--tRNA ligase subunit beta n=1 Tax=Parasphingorhabdus sp. JC815 TaxID=3232140 RepID=UPI0034579300
MTDFLLELLSEEIPARMQAKARTDLERLFVAQLDEAGLKSGEITVYSTPRRLALIAKDLPEQTKAVSEEAKGPPEGAPDQAIDGFCRKNGVTRDQLEVRDVKGRATLFAVINKPGRATSDVLSQAIPAIIKAFPWPKSMRWGDASQSTESLRWVRPLSGIVAILGDDLVPCEIDGVASGYETIGHRFHHDGKITIGNAGDYAEKLHACHVLVDQAEREAIIRDGAAKAASDAGLELVADEGLVIENAGLTEWPVPLLGSFDPAFLDVPEEVIQLSARVNQKYFICRDKNGNLAPNFVCTANIDATDGGKAIVAGNEKVLAARLSDAKFFWELDQKTALEDHAKKLSNIVFHEKLGTVADKVERVAKLAEWLASLEGTGLLHANPEQTKQAARLCKADLVTEMVGEFPELQGLMGGYYAEKEGLPVEVSHAIRDHYKPVGQGDDVPTDPVTVCVSLADKLDTLACFFAIGEKPTGSKDPFALRRAALAIVALIMNNGLRFNLSHIIKFVYNLLCDQLSIRLYPEQISYLDGLEFQTLYNRPIKYDASRPIYLQYLPRDHEGRQVATSRAEVEKTDAYAEVMLLPLDDVTHGVLGFMADRFKVQQREAGVRHDLIDAVFALGGEDDLVRLLARVKALQAFVETEEGTNLLAGYKRASNILKKEGDTLSNTRHPELVSGSPEAGTTSDEMLNRKATEGKQVQHDDYDREPAETALIEALDTAEPKAAAAVEAEDFEGAMAALASLRAPIDAFFDNVTVNDDDPAKRTARLAMLARVREAVHTVADFSKIEG